MVFETKLVGCHALVTGGSRGIGRAIVEALTAEGCNVSYCARTIPETTTERKEGDTSAVAHGTVVDVGDRTRLTEWVEASARRFGRLDIVVANASAMNFEGTPAAWRESFDVDLMGFVNVVTAALPWLERSPQASVVVLSSLMAREQYKTPPAGYGPLKAAQLQHVQELSHFHGPKGIRVNAISPGPVFFEGGAWEAYRAAAPEWVEAQTEKIALRRLGTPEEIANVAVFLASPLSGFVAGMNILADGGNHVGTTF